MGLPPKQSRIIYLIRQYRELDLRGGLLSGDDIDKMTLIEEELYEHSQDFEASNDPEEIDFKERIIDRFFNALEDSNDE